MTRLLLAATWLLVAWGALAFGAVYPWAWRPLVTGAAVVGAGSWLWARRYGGGADDRALLAALLAVGLGAAVQLVPIPRDLRTAISPASERLLLEQDLEYAAAALIDGSVEGARAPRPDRPLSINPPATARGLVLLAGLALLLAGLTRLLNITGARRLATWLVVLGAALAVIGIVQRAILGDHAFGGMRIYGFWEPRNLLTTPFGPFVNKNHFAGWMLMGLPLGIGLGLGWAERSGHRAARGWREALLWLSSPGGGRLQLAALAVVVMGVALVMTRSRSGIAGLVLAAAVAAVGAGRRFGSLKTRSAAIGGLALLLVAVFAWADAGIADRFTAGGGSIDLRRRIWSDSAAVIRDFPLTGTGLNTFGTAMLSYQRTQRETHFQEAHNDYLQVVVEGGILLGVPSGVALVLLVAGIRRRFALAQDDAMTYWLRSGATAGLVAIGLQSLVEFSLQMPGNAVMGVVLMAIALHEPPARVSSRRVTA